LGINKQRVVTVSFLNLVVAERYRATLFFIFEIHFKTE